jgi:hypothetical protein
MATEGTPDAREERLTEEFFSKARRGACTV